MKKKISRKLSGRSARYLRGLGHHLRPLATVGREGVTANLLKAVDELLAAHELVKVKIGQGCELNRREAAEVMGTQTGAAVVQVLGRTVLLFRQNPDRDDGARIILPSR